MTSLPEGEKLAAKEAFFAQQAQADAKATKIRKKKAKRAKAAKKAAKKSRANGKRRVAMESRLARRRIVMDARIAKIVARAAEQAEIAVSTQEQLGVFELTKHRLQQTQQSCVDNKVRMAALWAEKEKAESQSLQLLTKIEVRDGMIADLKREAKVMASFAQEKLDALNLAQENSAAIRAALQSEMATLKATISTSSNSTHVPRLVGQKKKKPRNQQKTRRKLHTVSHAAVHIQAVQRMRLARSRVLRKKARAAEEIKQKRAALELRRQKTQKQQDNRVRLAGKKHMAALERDVQVCDCVMPACSSFVCVFSELQLRADSVLLVRSCLYPCIQGVARQRLVNCPGCGGSSGGCRGDDSPSPTVAPGRHQGREDGIKPRFLERRKGEGRGGSGGT